MKRHFDMQDYSFLTNVSSVNQTLVFAFTSPFSKDPKHIKNWLDKVVKEASEVLGEPNKTCL